MPTPKPVNRMSRRERFERQRVEIRYAIELIKTRLDYLRKESLMPPRLFVGLTTKAESRAFLTSALVKHGLTYIIVAAGRISQFDQMASYSKSVFHPIPGVDAEFGYIEEVKTLLESFVVLLDAISYIESPKGQHAMYAGHQPIKMSDVSSALREIIRKHSVIKGVK